MTSALVLAAPGLAEYMEELEERLRQAVAWDGGVAGAVGAEALGAGGKRLRPMLVFLASPPDRPPPVAAGVAVELVHLATLVHDDLIDGAELRRGRRAVWAAHGAPAACAAGDYLFARAFAELAGTGEARLVQVLADSCLALVRGEAMQRRQTRRADTTPAEVIARLTLKTGKLFEAACLLGGAQGLGPFGLKLGVAFQIADDILDCSGQTQETGKIAGTDLREGTPTLPLLYAAEEDAFVAEALAGGPLESALVRVAATGALARARERALDYAADARSHLNGALHREELEALTYAVVDRAG
jgi:geranylgeranyl pyrophosphate synthase